MARGWLAIIAVGLMLTSPASAWSVFHDIKPEKAVMAAAKAGPDGVGGVFEMVVRGIGHQGGHLYLNSESDYRDQRNLTIAMSDTTGAALVEKAGLASYEALVGRKIFVHGVARKVRIDFTVDGHPTSKYYYQTHVVVTTPAQIAVKDKL